MYTFSSSFNWKISLGRYSSLGASMFISLNDIFPLTNTLDGMVLIFGSFSDTFCNDKPSNKYSDISSIWIIIDNSRSFVKFSKTPGARLLVVKPWIVFRYFRLLNTPFVRLNKWLPDISMYSSIVAFKRTSFGKVCIKLYPKSTERIALYFMNTSTDPWCENVILL